MNQRPTGVTILAVLAFVGGVVSILFGGLGALFGGIFGSFLSPALGGLVAVWGLLHLILGVAYIYVGWGFWRLVSATWRFGIFVSAAAILVAVLQGVFGYGFDIVGILISIAVIYYLLTPGVKAAFGITGDLQTAVLGGMGSATAGAASTSAPAATPPPAPPPAAEPPAAPAPAAEPPASTWSGSGESSGGSAPSAGTDDSDPNA